MKHPPTTFVHHLAGRLRCRKCAKAGRRPSATLLQLAESGGKGKLEPLDKGLMGTLLRYPYEVRDPKEYFDDIQDVKVTKDMLDLARHIVDQKAGHFEPEKFEDQYETALLDLINQKRAGKPIAAKERPRGENVVDLMDALRKSIGGGAAPPTEAPKKSAKKPRKAAAGQKEMLMPIAGKKPAKETVAKKPAAKPQRKSA
jgi:DNA end-binding protein Ku